MESVLQNAISAVGGFDLSLDPPRYVLGDDGLGCLKDLKRWLQFFDDRNDSWDVKDFVAEKNFVQTDVCSILQLCYSEGECPPLLRRTALACVEILVPLTWPMTLDSPTISKEQLTQYPRLRIAQIAYRDALLDERVLRSILSVAVDSMSIDRHERSSRDEGIMRLVLYLIRNLIVINEIEGKVQVIEAFQRADLFDFLLVLGSNIQHDFTSHVSLLAEILYYLLRGSKPEQLYSSSKQVAALTDLSNLLKKEKDVARHKSQHTNSRHNRFGTMISLVTKENQRFTVSNQTSLKEDSALSSLNNVKKWKKPKQKLANLPDIDRSPALYGSSLSILREFCDNFLDSSFNPTFARLLRDLEREDETLTQIHKEAYLYLISFFIHALRCRTQKSNEGKDEAFREDGDWALVGSVLIENAFIMMNKLLREAMDNEIWALLHCGLHCFKEKLLLIQNMELSSEEEYHEIAENLQKRIFYQEATLDLVVATVRQPKNRTLGYLDACTDLVSTFVKMLEKYANSQQYMYIKSRRKTQRRKKATTGEDHETNDDEGEALAAKSVAVARERAFEFSKFENKILNDKTVSTYLKFLSVYQDLTPQQIHRCVSYFHRLFVKRKVQTLLYRMDFIILFTGMLSDKTAFPSNHPSRKEVEQLTIYFSRKLSQSLELVPILFVEMLFEKFPSSLHYLETGTEVEPAQAAPLRAAAQLEVKAGFELDQQIGIVISALVDQKKEDLVDWLKTHYSNCLSARSLSVQSTDQAALLHQTEVANFDDFEMEAESSAVQKALVKDGKLRLLLDLVGSRESDLDMGQYSIPGEMTLADLKSKYDLLRKFSDDPPVFGDQEAASLIRYKASRAMSSDSEGDSSSEDDLASLSGSGTGLEKDSSEKRKEKSERRKKAKKHERRSKGGEASTKRKLAAAERRRQENEQIKSSKYVVDSDDEAADAVFFAAEAALRERMDQTGGSLGDRPKAQKRQRKSVKNAALANDGPTVGVSGDGFDSDDEQSIQPPTKKTNPLNSDSQLLSDHSVEHGASSDVSISSDQEGTDGDQEDVEIDTENAHETPSTQIPAQRRRRIMSDDSE